MKVLELIEYKMWTFTSSFFIFIEVRKMWTFSCDNDVSDASSMTYMVTKQEKKISENPFLKKKKQVKKRLCQIVL